MPEKKPKVVAVVGPTAVGKSALVLRLAKVFGAEIVKYLPKTAVPTLNLIIRTITQLKLERISHDVIGKVFHGLIPEKIRKRVAAYYTTNPAATLLAKLCVKNSSDVVLDPSCGSGTLLVAPYKIKKEL